VRTDMEFWTEVRRQVLTHELSQRAACQKYKLGWHTVKKILTHAEPPGDRQREPRQQRKLAAFLPLVEQMLEADQQAPKKQRHTAKRVSRYDYSRCFLSRWPSPRLFARTRLVPRLPGEQPAVPTARRPRSPNRKTKGGRDQWPVGCGRSECLGIPIDFDKVGSVTTNWSAARRLPRSVATGLPRNI
jgi:hypothetical protein